MPTSGSNREYYRILGNSRKVIGVINNDREENRAFLEFSKHFKKNNIAVPEIFSKDLDNNVYLEEDLDDQTLFNYLLEVRNNGDFPNELVIIYKKILDELLKFQIIAGKDLNYSFCYPRASFDKQSMNWDLSYFKYYFLKLADIPFNEQKLEDDYNTFMNFLLSENCNYFLYRDFQSRNIMLKDDKIFFIDYQGGRKGALQYDVASLLYDSKADIPQQIREELLDYYIESLKKYQEVDVEKFKQYYYGYVLIRMMQAMGAYGFRGFYEKKKHFLQSIPYALKNLRWILNNIELPIAIHEMIDVLNRITTSEKLKKFEPKEKRKSPLTVSISSFSYKNGIPEDRNGHGGGYVFDCRVLHNPGKYNKYKELTGKDRDVIDFFEQEEDIHDFLENVFSLVDMTVEKYVDRNFTNLMVSFGCTGGQHRSVYSAEKLKEHLQEKYAIQMVLWHREMD
ncbi:MAG: phosphotransferase enzyme family protein [Chlorobi bacterium]|nr:phosphotransferase enzyme family protein [Chlorobiota bacterium]